MQLQAAVDDPSHAFHENRAPHLMPCASGIGLSADGRSHVVCLASMKSLYGSNIVYAGCRRERPRVLRGTARGAVPSTSARLRPSETAPLCSMRSDRRTQAKRASCSPGLRKVPTWTDSARLRLEPYNYATSRLPYIGRESSRRSEHIALALHSDSTRFVDRAHHDVCYAQSFARRHRRCAR
ncbi:hypothetical protein BD310DRAFT_675963 [Dichomitus squalens]|uniref:Uncharacterized protein n=1 Tax=Dichomitus squalens TaxID=114155 RepID=A0A4Q9PMY7_9APHY|nr:hypothetical protein BD310DRAFT_675963 [Dichomitus squalens]